MAQPTLLTLISDLGTSDPALAQVKGWLCVHYREVNIVDLSHELPVDQAAVAGFRWQRAWPWFPAETVHCCLMDRGHGDVLWLLRCREHWLAAIDEDCLRAAIPRGEQPMVWCLRWAGEGSATFRARDSLLPQALAAVTKGDPATLGWQPQPAWPHAELSPDRARVADCDHFGNLILDYPSAIPIAAVLHGGQRIPTLRGTYAEVQGLVAIAGCDGLWEISLSAGRACDALDLRVGDWVSIVAGPENRESQKG